MRQLVNKNLITLKCVLFCFLSGIGCIFPFLPLHMLSVGLDRGEARLISAVAPCIALLGPALLGPLIDKLSVGRGSTGGSNSPSDSGRLLRIVTAVCLILSALFYTLLLAVPYTERHEARRPDVLFMCDGEGAYVMQKLCTEDKRCNRWAGSKSGVLAVGNCEYGCADDNMTWLQTAFPSTTSTTTLSPMWAGVANATSTLAPETDDDDGEDYAVNPPHLCYDGVCQVYMSHAGRMRIPLSLLAPEEPDGDNATDSDQAWCTYRTGLPSHCEVPREKLSESELTKDCTPAVRCEVLDPYDEPNTVLADGECRLVIGDPGYTFWTYFVIRVLADIWPTAALALLGAACVIATRETSLGRGDVGRQLAFGTIGLAIFPPLAGLASQNMPDDPYLVPFVMHAVFMVIGALILLVDKNMPLSTPEWWWHTATGVLTMPMNAIRRYGAETAAIFFVVTLLGVLWSGIDAYLPWTVSDVTSDPNMTFVELGLTMTAGAIPAIPVLFWAEAVVDYIGHSNVFIIAFTFYCLRYTGLAFTTDYTWVVVCELLEVFTLSLVWVTAILYFRHLVPRKYTATGQALPVIAHFCIGRCIGAIISGMVSVADEPALWASRDVYRGLGVAALLSAAVYLGLYHLILAPRCAAPAQPPPQNLIQGATANGGSNGTYSPLRVYHEERSRKGHFRY
ncbi:MFS_1 like family domain-containing protein [Phthorimaea operculella]|nr:MFS_1 like family domain-containing protein [Phthorimaea operculella]